LKTAVNRNNDSFLRQSFRQWQVTIWQLIEVPGIASAVSFKAAFR